MSHTHQERPVPAAATDWSLDTDYDRLPTWLLDQLDLTDPDLWAILDAVEQMTAAGHDASTPDGFAVCVAAGHRRAAMVREHWTDERIAAQRDHALAAVAARAAQREADCHVYYLRFADLVKIGYSRDVPQRVREIGAGDELLAVEPGGPLRERQRHDEFTDLHDHREWFRLHQPLIGHIAALREQHPLPVALPGAGNGPRPFDPTGRLLTVEQAAVRFGVTQAVIRQWLCRPKVPVWRHDGLLDPNEITAYLLARAEKRHAQRKPCKSGACGDDPV